MSQVVPRRFRSVLVSLAVLAGGCVIATVGATAAPAAPATTSAKSLAAGLNTGQYYVFRTRDTGKGATNEQNSRCNKYFGIRAVSTITRLNALLFAYEATPTTGRIANQTASLLGPGFICAAPALGGQDALDAYAYSSLPGPGLVEATGPCNLEPVVVANLPLLLSCGLKVRANPAKGIEGGLITSNSLVNLLNRSSSAPTGSVWTAHVVGSSTNDGGSAGPVPTGTKPETPGLDFFTTRTRDESVSTSSPDCLKAGVAEHQLAVRTTNLAVAQPDAVSGLVPDASGPAVGKLTVCYLYAARAGYKAVALATLKTATGTFEVKAKGSCRTSATVVSPELREQSCVLTVGTGSTAGGLITSNGLIEAGQPASAADSAVWTMALFGAPPAA